MVINSTAPRKTLTSQKWLRRNDSSSISSILHIDEEDDDDICQKYRQNQAEDSDSDDSEPRRITILSQPQKHGPHKIYKAYCPDCYCKSFPIAPKMGKPRDSCCCKTSQETTQPCRRPKSTIRKPAGMYTKRRESYEQKARDYFKTLKERLDELERDLKEEEAEIQRKKEEYQRLQQRRCPCTEETCPNLNPRKPNQSKPNFKEPNLEVPRHNSEESSKIKDLQSFRNEHYFDCHSSSVSLDKIQPEKNQQCVNTCLHKVNLNSNLKFEPVNVDSYGTSRCQFCRKSLSADTLTNPPTSNSRSLVFAKSSLENLNLLPLEGDTSEEQSHISEHLKDKMFLTTRKNEQLEVTLPHNFLNEVQKPQTLSMLQTKTYKNFKLPMPADSMALRFQKGMIKKSFANMPRSQ